jgi:hypothetical protein
MHVQIILEMIGCCLHLLENFLYAQQANVWFIQEREKVQDLHYLLSRFPTRTRLCSAISSCWCNCLLSIAILLILLETYTISPYLENLTTIPLWYPLKLSIRTYWVWSMIPSN